MSKNNTRTNPFTKHPKEVNENYFQHFIVAMSYFLIFLRLSTVSFIHAFFPFLFTKTASTEIIDIANKLKKRK